MLTRDGKLGIVKVTHRRLACQVAWLLSLAALACSGLAVESVTPSRGYNTTSTAIVVRGAGFKSSAVVSVGDAALTTTSASSTALTAVVPAALADGVYDVVVTQSGQSARLAAAFRVIASSLRIVAVEVGQGDATLVISPTGAAGLIDQGDVGSGPKVQAAMARYGVTTLDWILVTHYHADHYGAVLEVPLPTAAYDRGEPAGAGDARYQSYKSAMGNRRKAVAVGEAIDLGGGTSMTVVAVNGRVLDGGVVATNPSEENENSVGVLIAHGRFRYLSLGDLTGATAVGETDVETTVGNAVGNVDVYHVSHHGSGGSSSDAFIRKIRPEVAVVSEGQNNVHCHPSQATLNRLSNEGVAIYSTSAGITLGDGGCAVTAFPAGSRILNGDIEITTVTGDVYSVAGDVRDGGL